MHLDLPSIWLRGTSILAPHQYTHFIFPHISRRFRPPLRRVQFLSYNDLFLVQDWFCELIFEAEFHFYFCSCLLSRRRPFLEKIYDRAKTQPRHNYATTSRVRLLDRLCEENNSHEGHSSAIQSFRVGLFRWWIRPNAPPKLTCHHSQRTRCHQFDQSESWQLIWERNMASVDFPPRLVHRSSICHLGVVMSEILPLPTVVSRRAGNQT